MMETNQPTKKDSGMETKPGEESGKMAQSAPGNMEVSEPETAGEKKMSTRQDTTPVYMEATAPAVLNRRQYREYRMVGRLAEAATANARETRKATFWVMARMPKMMETMPRTTTVAWETRTCSASVDSPLRITAW